MGTIQWEKHLIMIEISPVTVNAVMTIEAGRPEEPGVIRHKGSVYLVMTVLADQRLELGKTVQVAIITHHLAVPVDLLVGVQGIANQLMLKICRKVVDQTCLRAVMVGVAVAAAVNQRVQPCVGQVPVHIERFVGVVAGGAEAWAFSSPGLNILLPVLA